MKNTRKKSVAIMLTVALVVGAMPSIQMTATAATTDARFIMDAEALSDSEIAVLFAKGGTSSSGVISGGTLCYGVYNTLTSAWNEQTVGATGVSASEAALDIYEGAPHVAYVNTDGDIAYTFLDDTGWSDVSIITSNDCNELEGILSYPDIEVNSDGVAYVSYMDTQGAPDDRYKYSDVMIANNSTGSFVNSVLLSGTGWFDSPDGYLERGDFPKTILTNSGFAVVYYWVSTERYYGGNNTEHDLCLYSNASTTRYWDTNSAHSLYEACSDGKNVYALTYRSGYKVIKYTKGSNGYSSDVIVGPLTDVSKYAADLSIDNDKLYITAASGSSLLFYMDGAKETFNAATGINTNHNKAASVVVDETPYILYTGSDEDYSLVITKYNGTGFEEKIIPKDPTPAEVFLAQVADDTTSTITLTEDIDISANNGLTVSKDLTIDLNGHKLTVGEAGNVHFIYSDTGVLTINDSAGTGSIEYLDDLMADNGGTIIINGGAFHISDIGFTAESEDITINGGTYYINEGADTWDKSWNAFLSTGKMVERDATDGFYTVVDANLANGLYKQTAQSGSKYYTRFVFVVPKSDFAGKNKAKFTATYNSTPYTFETSTYYTGVTSNGITYTPDSEDSAMFVVTISSGSDISNDITCKLDFE